MGWRGVTLCIIKCMSPSGSKGIPGFQLFSFGFKIQAKSIPASLLFTQLDSQLSVLSVAEALQSEGDSIPLVDEAL